MAESKLKELLFDDDQIVTYTRLSKQLNVHVNESKRILWEFWRSNKANATISATFAIMGQLSDNTDRIEVVGESALPVTKGKFQTIYSEHIYSLQKSLSDLQILTLTELPYTQYSSIKCKESSVKFHQDSPNSQPVSKLTEQTLKSFEPRKVEPVEANSHSKVAEEEVRETTDSSLSDGKKEKVNKTTTTKEKSKKVSEKASKKPIQSRAAGFRSMFSKVDDANSKRLASQKEEAEKKKEADNKKMSVCDSDTDEEIERKESPIKSNKKEKTTETKNSQKTSKKDGKRKIESVNNVKKRRRIIAESDSSEEEPDSNDFQEEIKENSISFENTEECKKPADSPERNNTSGKHVVHKMEDVRFVDDDGFLVTKKVNVSTVVTTDAAKERSPSPKKSKEVALNKKQTKQSTLTSFFKRK